MSECIDIEITCVECRRPFLHSAGAQQFYADRGLYPPRRCPACRQARRVAQQQAAEQEGVSR